MEYWIDGYNLLFFLSNEEENFENSRQELIDYISKNHSNKKLTIIFDAHHRDDEFVHITVNKGIKVIFTPSKVTADEFIIEKLSYEKNPKIITIVTSDRTVLSNAQSLGAKTQKLKTFLKGVHNQKSPAEEKPNIDSDPELDRLLKAFMKKLED